ncbi:E3 ubiquitin-protein ligase DCST1 [Agrilus planipennis]|uniref:E3 ubiquitin-protein ligase DCST1 n=1 Tax=Agrilus planipennis TaxID=224129 RepID=A0A1W4XSW1_AGRPL|nr:E3 ubiquitin-protein ligase DCST1 [Agrilus planipennis]
MKMKRKYLPLPSKKQLIKIFPFLKPLLFSDENEHKALKIVCKFVFGLLLGIAFYEMIIVDLSFPPTISFSVGALASLLLAFGFAFSLQIRCITLLTFPTFGGKAGRGVLKALVLTFIISGPVQNISNNGKEIVRVYSCTIWLTSNLTKTRVELIFKPFMEAIFGLKNDVAEVKETIQTIRDVSSPIVDEVEGEQEVIRLREENDYLDSKLDDTKRSDELKKKYSTKGEQNEAERYQKMYLEKVELRCEYQLSKASNKCRDMFAKAYDTCYDTVTWFAAWLLCWPMKLTFVCNIAQALGGSSRCDPSKAVDPGFGEGYFYLKRSTDELTQNFKDVRLQYKVPKVPQLLDYRDASDTAKAMMHDVQRKKDILDKIIKLLMRLLAFVFLKIIIKSQTYHDKYLREIQFDNIYITKYFRRIDARRYANGKHTLLPLKKIERKKLIDPRSAVPLQTERGQLFGQTLRLALEIVTATTFILLDRLLYETLMVVRHHGRIDYIQTGHHDMTIKVKGTGLIAGLLRSVVKGFNFKKRIKSYKTNQGCLPNPALLPNYYLYKIFGIYFVVWCLIISQAYALRLRRVICSYFYRKREKRRVLYLYNETLKRRVAFMRHMEQKVKKMARQQRLRENLNICAVLRTKYPKIFNWLKMFKTARRKCIICGDPEPLIPTGKPGDYEKCKTPTCHFVHCAECWEDVGKQCFACKESPTLEDSAYEESDEYVDDST